jgi:hypothetical protein
MRYCLRTLLMVLALGPPILAASWIEVGPPTGVPLGMLRHYDALILSAGLAIAIVLAIGLGYVVASIGNAAIGLWDRR